jgi:hypothetical protein
VVPDRETDVELPLEDAVEQDRAVAPELGDPLNTPGAESVLEVDEADYAEQQSVVGYDDEDYR